MPERLSNEAIPRLSPAVRRPRYDRTQLRSGIVHLGLGAFARAHLVDYTEDVLEQAAAAGRSLAWGITGASLRHRDQRDRLAPQDGLYTAIERRVDGPTVRLYGALREVLVAPENPAALLEALAAPDVRIASLTVTEKGYCLDPSSGELQSDHPDILADHRNPDAPVSALGYLVGGLRLRRVRGLAPFTALCCDNLTGNGAVLRRLVLAHATGSDPGLADWIARFGAFPDTMVDRIVPATSAEDLADAARLSGLEDTAALAHEPFKQWVIQDCFVAGDRPEWEAAGAELVSDVAPFERMKLRMLNAAHSALAYLGYLAGHETIGDAMADARFAGFCGCLWHEEIIPAMDDLPRPALEAYATKLAARFANPSIRHRTWQIAMDGSQKLPQRILPTLAARAAAGLASPRLSLAVAAWITYVGGRDERGGAIDVRDPLAAVLRRRLDEAGGDAAARVRAVLSLATIFPPAFAENEALLAPIVAAYAALQHSGAAASVASIVQTG